MHNNRKPDFSGYASKAGLRCSDGLTILAHAFKDKDGQKVPLVWQHMHNDPEMVLGHAYVEDRPDGTYVYGYLNDGPMAKQAKRMLIHGDIEQMSVFARRLVKRGMDVIHGALQEVSLVLAGANPGSSIENVAMQHADGTITDIDDEVIITTGLKLTVDALAHADSDKGDTVATTTEELDDEKLIEIYEGMGEKEKTLVQYLVQKNASLVSDSDDSDDDDDDDDIQHSDDSDDTDDADDSSDSDDSDDDASDDDTDDDSDDSDDTDQTNDDSDDSDDSDDDDDSNDDSDADDKVQHDDLNSQENDMTHRVFDKTSTDDGLHKGSVLSHSQIKTILNDAENKYGSLKESVLAHADDYGIQNIGTLFPDAKTLNNTPELIKRRTEWVDHVLTRTKHAPFARIKSIQADITADEARAKGYVTGTEKKDEVFSLLHRITTPTTIYKKQKLDRDDIIDITDFDVVVFLKMEMRLMLEEELARAILLGDGRSVSDPDKVKDPRGATEGSGIRSIANDHDLYAHQVQLSSGSASNTEARIDELIRSRSALKGSGTPTFYTTLPFITDILLHKDGLGRRIYTSLADVASALMVDVIIPVEPMEGHQDILGIFVNLQDYTIGTDKGGEINFFDDFDLNWNQYEYLLETRSSGALTKVKSAVVVRRTLGTLVTNLVGPSFDAEENTLTFPTIAGVEYFIDGVQVTDTEELITKNVIVEARPTEGYDFPVGVTTSWPFSFSG